MRWRVRRLSQGKSFRPSASSVHSSAPRERVRSGALQRTGKADAVATSNRTPAAVGEAARTVTAVMDPDLTQAISGLPTEPRTSSYGSGRAVVMRTRVVLMASQASWWEGPKDRGHSRSVGRL